MKLNTAAKLDATYGGLIVALTMQCKLSVFFAKIFRREAHIERIFGSDGIMTLPPFRGCRPSGIQRFR